MHFSPGAAALRAGVERLWGGRAEILGFQCILVGSIFIFWVGPLKTTGTERCPCQPLPAPAGPCPGRTRALIDLIPSFFTYGTPYLFYKSRLGTATLFHKK